MINWLELITMLTGLMATTALITTLIIEMFKKILTEKVISEKFKSMEIFSLIITLVISMLVYAIYLLFFVIGKYDIQMLDCIKLIACGLVYMVACSVSSQVGYDKVIKLIKDLITKE